MLKEEKFYNEPVQVFEDDTIFSKYFCHPIYNRGEE